MSDQFTKQLNTLISERDAHNASTATSDRDRRHNETLLQSQRSTIQQIADQLNAATSTLGETSRKLENLNDASRRFEDSIRSDREDMVGVTDELNGIESQDRAQKWEFVKDLDVVHDELDTLLCKRENEKAMRLVDAEAMGWLLESMKLDGLLKRRLDGMDEEYKEAEGEKWRVVLRGIEEAVKGLKEASDNVGRRGTDKSELVKVAVAHREKFVLVHPNLGQNEIDSLEMKWEDTIELTDDINDPANDSMAVDGQNLPNKTGHDGTSTDPVHMDLFYHEGQ